MTVLKEGESEDKKICLCKEVSYKTIKEAVLAGAKSIEEVRGRTRANTGCATLCTEDVEKIIQKYKNS